MASARRLFASDGVFRVRVADIVSDAGQRNSSALTYHFKSRSGVLREILDRHNDPIDAERGRHLAALGPEPTTRALVAALLRPYSTQLDSVEGRQYLQIVDQLGAEVIDRDFEVGSVAGANLQRVFARLLERPADVPIEARRQRLFAAVIVMTGSMADRARHIDAGEAIGLDAESYLANLADMIVGVLDAVPGGRLPTLR